MSGLVSNWTVAERVPVTEYVTRHATQGVLPDKFVDCPFVGTPTPAAVKVIEKVQSALALWACAILVGGSLLSTNNNSAMETAKAKALRSVRMNTIVRRGNQDLLIGTPHPPNDSTSFATGFHLVSSVAINIFPPSDEFSTMPESPGTYRT